MNPFSKNITERAVKMGWNTVNANIISINDSNGIAQDLTIEYGYTTKAYIRTAVEVYANHNTCQVQNNIQMYHCIHNSLKKDGKWKF